MNKRLTKALTGLFLELKISKAVMGEKFIPIPTEIYNHSNEKKYIIGIENLSRSLGQLRYVRTMSNDEPYIINLKKEISNTLEEIKKYSDKTEKANII